MPRYIGRRLRIIREVPWPEWHHSPLAAEIKPGAVVWEFLGCTYGCIAVSEIAVSLESGTTPFWGVPGDAVEEFPEDPFMIEIRERARESARRMIGDPYATRLRVACADVNENGA